MKQRLNMRLEEVRGKSENKTIEAQSIVSITVLILKWLYELRNKA